MPKRIVTLRLHSGESTTELKLEVEPARGPSEYLVRRREREAEPGALSEAEPEAEPGALSEAEPEALPEVLPEIGLKELMDEASIYGYLRRVASAGGDQVVKILEPRLVVLRELVGAPPSGDLIDVNLDDGP